MTFRKSQAKFYYFDTMDIFWLIKGIIRVNKLKIFIFTIMFPLELALNVLLRRAISLLFDKHLIFYALNVLKSSVANFCLNR